MCLQHQTPNSSRSERFQPEGIAFARCGTTRIGCWTRSSGGWRPRQWSMTWGSTCRTWGCPSGWSARTKLSTWIWSRWKACGSAWNCQPPASPSSAIDTTTRRTRATSASRRPTVSWTSSVRSTGTPSEMRYWISWRSWAIKDRSRARRRKGRNVEFLLA